jgi:putative transposase
MRMDYRHGAHTVFTGHLHLVWTTKYRKPVLTGEVGLRVRELIRFRVEGEAAQEGGPPKPSA